MKFQIASPSHYFTDLDLPWERHLTEWPQEFFVPVAKGIHRNVVGFVARGDKVYALKELAQPIAEKEYRLLRELEELGLPVVEPIGIVTERDQTLLGRVTQSEHDLKGRALLITRYLDGALPYRVIIERGTSSLQLQQMLDALAELMVRLHLSGFYWGDCSLSNALFRRDAGLLAAYLVDAETGELLPELSDSRRDYDLELAFTNLAGDLMDLEALLGGLPGNLDPVELAEKLVERYRDLWHELKSDQVFSSDEQYLVEQRLQRLNELGFDVDEMQLESVEGGSRIRMRAKVVEPWHHKRIIHNLTGLKVEENQARRLLNDINRYRAYWSGESGREMPEVVAAYRWLTEVFQTTIDRIPNALREGLDEAELYHEILEHRWYMSERASQDIGLEQAVQSYVEDVLQRSESRLQKEARLLQEK
ncbi:DUF4032 domain-containing protein [Natronospirillum operosum]|uniref:DUF4032 domain-containing protein n=1 Tax=Natronospirillum operosum TaxID=2759953 RepID=A0A4Z0WFR7_9GAMM|nr:DUF4032 domain-containing protein [Natronospirillum operosum]TGG95880.1 DUF4032 domain-containing protein [Natronospirillum operosum]